MPIYRYRCVDDAGACDACRVDFEVQQRLSEDPLDACPFCGSAIQRIITAPFVGGGDAHRLKEGHLEKHGFTQYRKVGKGKYEKTAGRGPRRISDDS